MTGPIATCPLCGGNNYCAASSASCWCKQAALHDALPAALRELAGEHSKRCICQRCVNAYHADPGGFIARHAASAQNNSQ